MCYYILVSFFGHSCMRARPQCDLDHYWFHIRSQMDWMCSALGILILSRRWSRVDGWMVRYNSNYWLFPKLPHPIAHLYPNHLHYHSHLHRNTDWGVHSDVERAEADCCITKLSESVFHVKIASDALLLYCAIKSVLNFKYKILKIVIEVAVREYVELLIHIAAVCYLSDLIYAFAGGIKIE